MLIINEIIKGLTKTNYLFNLVSTPLFSSLYKQIYLD